MRRGWILGLGALAAATVAVPLLALGGRSDLPEYRTQPAERGDVVDTVTASGTLNAVVLVEVGSQISGQVSELLADFNSAVHQGEVIARIDPETYQARLSAAEADLDVAQATVAVQRALVERSGAEIENAKAALAAAKAQTQRGQIGVDDAKADFDRKEKLTERGIVSASDWQKTQNAYQSALAQLSSARAQELQQGSTIRSSEAGLLMAQAQLQNALAQVREKDAGLRQARVDLERTYIRAPVDGVVVARSVNRGQTVAASLQAPTLFTIAQDLRHMQVEASVSEADVGRVVVGQGASFVVDAYPGRRFGGAVVQIRKAPQVVQNVVTYIVIVSADNPEELLLPGMTATLSLVTARRDNVLRVPNAALRFHPPGTQVATDRVFVVDPVGKAAPVGLRLGITDGIMTEVAGGDLADGTPVIVGIQPTPPSPANRLPRLF